MEDRGLLFPYQLNLMPFPINFAHLSAIWHDQAHAIAQKGALMLIDGNNKESTLWRFIKEKGKIFSKNGFINICIS